MKTRRCILLNTLLAVVLSITICTPAFAKTVIRICPVGEVTVGVESNGNVICSADQTNDGDIDSTNELQDWATLPGIPADIKDGDDEGALADQTCEEGKVVTGVDVDGFVVCANAVSETLYTISRFCNSSDESTHTLNISDLCHYVPEQDSMRVTASCDFGDQLISGGCDARRVGTVVTGSYLWGSDVCHDSPDVFGPCRDDSVGNIWECSFRDDSGVLLGVAHAICRDNTP